MSAQLGAAGVDLGEMEAGLEEEVVAEAAPETEAIAVAAES
jgi:small subunit ribosomal protein S2